MGAEVIDPEDYPGDTDHGGNPPDIGDPDEA
jgi:hypothetical protein